MGTVVRIRHTRDDRPRRNKLWHEQWQLFVVLGVATGAYVMMADQPGPPVGTPGFPDLQTAASAQIVGIASVIDGDTIEIHGARMGRGRA